MINATLYINILQSVTMDRETQSYIRGLELLIDDQRDFIDRQNKELAKVLSVSDVHRLHNVCGSDVETCRQNVLKSLDVIGIDPEPPASGIKALTDALMDCRESLEEMFALYFGQSASRPESLMGMIRAMLDGMRKRHDKMGLDNDLGVCRERHERWELMLECLKSIGEKADVTIDEYDTLALFRLSLERLEKSLLKKGMFPNALPVRIRSPSVVPRDMATPRP